MFSWVWSGQKHMDRITSHYVGLGEASRILDAVHVSCTSVPVQQTHPETCQSSEREKGRIHKKKLVITSLITRN